ncbi:MAG TPA: metallophosphoesterase [Anaerolineae bacterium]|nr:metallophosphoesterase [Anaerolineae bacterium]
MTGRPIPDIPPDRADGSSSWVHLGLIYSGRLGQIAPEYLTPLWVALIGGAAWMWGAQWIPTATLITVFFVGDWLMLALLPLTRRSWGPVTPPLLGLTLVRVGLFTLGAWFMSSNGGRSLIATVNVVLSLTAFYATWIEPFRVGVTRRQYTPPAGHIPETLRVLHLSDVHFERASLREAAVLAHIRDLQPDLIVLTGDYLNLSSVYQPEAQQGVRQFLSRLRAPLGVYAITGSPVVDVNGIVPEIFAELTNIHWLNDAAIKIPHDTAACWLLGIRCTYDEARDITALQQVYEQIPPDDWCVLLYHTPDLMPAAARIGVNLYLCGHTHGGQLCLPFYGALATSSRYGKRYEAGLYQTGQTTLYVSRGLGMEGLGAPRARFLAPPEIILWEFQGCRNEKL